VHAVGARAARIASLHQATALRVGIDTPVSADALAAAVKGSTRRLEVVIEVDCGAHRSGVQPEQAGALAAHAAAAGLAPVGVYTYPGHGARPDARRPAADDQLQALTTAVESLRDVGVEAELVSAGSTPTVAFSARGPITEIRPGEYIFADMDNVRLDACAEDDVALFVAGTVVSDTMPEHVIVDVGTKALGREGNPDKGYGYALGLGETCLHKLNEYHGFLSVASDQRPKVGTVIPIVPNHCCPLVNNFAELVVTDSEGRGLDRWAVAARGT
jgi:D-serine deaminase-like pyridoxal phosphate-dependent protein